MELLIWLLFGFICSVIASNKNRNVIGWFVLGTLFGIFSLIILACLPKLED